MLVSFIRVREVVHGRGSEAAGRAEKQDFLFEPRHPHCLHVRCFLRPDASGVMPRRSSTSVSGSGTLELPDSAEPMPAGGPPKLARHKLKSAISTAPLPLKSPSRQPPAEFR